MRKAGTMSGYHLSGVQCYHKFVLNEA